VKGFPKRGGEIVDMICKEAGIQERVSPGGVALHKSEATAVLQFILSMKELARKIDQAIAQDRKEVDA
jgi:hypothetical protein